MQLPRRRARGTLPPTTGSLWHSLLALGRSDTVCVPEHVWLSAAQTGPEQMSR